MLLVLIIATDLARCFPREARYSRNQRLKKQLKQRQQKRIKYARNKQTSNSTGGNRQYPPG